MLWCLIAVALAASIEQVESRLAEIGSLRELRLQRSAPTMSIANIKKAAQGTIVVGLSGSTAWGAAVLPIPIGQLWAGLNDETRHAGYSPVTHTELVSGRVCKSGRVVLRYLPVPVPMVEDRWWLSTLKSNGRIAQESGNSVRELAWYGSTDASKVTSASGLKLIDNAAPIASTRGGWFLVAIDQFSTYVEYHSRTDPGEGIPSSLSSRLAVQGVRAAIEAMQKFAKEGHPVCPVY